jgi:hypothetical protein
MRDTLIERHTNVAEIVARRFSASHSNTSRNDIKQDAYLALVLAVDSYGPDVSKPIGLYIYGYVHSYLCHAYQKEKERNAIAPTVSFGVFGSVDGDPLNSLRDLRSSSSLNPRADISVGLMEALGQVRSSAHLQNYPGKVFHSPSDPASQAYYGDEHGSSSDNSFYLWHSAMSRERVKRIKGNVSEVKARQILMALDQEATAA